MSDPTAVRTPRSRVALRAFAPSRLLICAIALAGCASESPTHPATNVAAADRLSHMYRVPLQRTGQLSALVKATVNGHEITLLLDTGAQSTLIDLGVAQRIGIGTQPGKFQTVGVGPGSINARQGQIVTLDLAGFPAQVRPTLQDFSPMINASMRRGTTPTVGLLGYDVLVSYGAIIDLNEGALYLRKQ